jgi:hypothetical protein
MSEKTVRANLSDLEHQQFIVIAANLGVKPTPLLGRIVRDFMAEQIRLNPAIIGGIVKVAERYATKEITTRQFARLKRLQVLVPNCSVNNSTDRVLTYPLRYEAIVLEFLANCPKGSRKERRAVREVPVYTARDLTAMPGLKKAKKERAKYESKHVRVTAEALDILGSGPKGIDELYSLLKLRKEVPGGKDPKYILKTLLGKSDQVVYSKTLKLYSLLVEEDDSADPEEEAPPTAQAEATVSEPEPVSETKTESDESVEPPPISETRVETFSSQSETVGPKVPAFFPRWAGS